MVKIKLADICVELENRYPDLEDFCRGYETELPGMMRLRVTPEELEQERRSQSYDFSDGYLETVCVYRKLALELLRYGIFVLHASVLEVNGKGYGFLAPSGTGKTTQTRLWLDYFGDAARVINGDKPLIRMCSQGESWQFTAYGTPWNGKERMGCNASVPLKALFLLERAEVPSCVRASEEDSIDRFFRQLLLPERTDQMEALLEMADRLIQTVPVYILRCNMTEESVKAAYEAVRKF